ncbi:MAG: Gfo/Idh/MocA family protein [Planctomycetota bacterium]
MRSSRRSFLGAAAAAAASSRLGATAAASGSLSESQQVPSPAGLRRPRRLMVIGVANRGGANLNGVQNETIAVLCDIDGEHLKKAKERFPEAETVTDYREVLTDATRCQKLDGVVISTPDHTHYHPAMLAIQQGLDVYCEKPLTQTIAQSRRLLVAAQARGCVTQMGIQIHARDNFRRVVEAVRAGAVGRVRDVYVFVNGTNWSASELPKTADAPEHVAWDTWLGPAQPRDFSPGYHPAGWRRYWAFGGGTTADMACHYSDLAFWALDLDAPTSLQADGPAPHPECAPDGMRCVYDYPARDVAGRGRREALKLHWHAAKDRPSEVLQKLGLEDWRNGVLFVGDDGWLVSNYDKHILGPDTRAAEWVPPPQTIAKSVGHHREWLDCCADRTQPSCSFAYSVPLTEAALLANVAYRAAAGKRIAWDAVTMRTDDAAANALLDVEARAGFDV